ncbi:MAG TPA: HutD family protein [Mycoplana sp.]|nr:HutD family protein [Mycoplana sp.]
MSMPEPKVLQATGRRHIPWKEGDGETLEVAVFPPESSPSDFEWRVSLTTVTSDGRFSSFPGVERTISVVEGSGLSLELDGKSPVVLTQRSEPFAFPADVPATASLVKGPVVDLDVMSRRVHWRHRVEKWHLEGQRHFDAPGGVTMLFSLGNLRVDAGHHAVQLRRHDCVLIDDVVLLTTDMPVEGFLIRFTKV